MIKRASTQSGKRITYLIKSSYYDIMYAIFYSRKIDDDRCGISWKSFAEINGRNSAHQVREIVLFNFISNVVENGKYSTSAFFTRSGGYGKTKK